MSNIRKKQNTRINSGLDDDIKNEIVIALSLLGAKSDLLGTIGSWQQELDDETVLSGIKSWNAVKRKELEERLFLGSTDNF